MANAKTKSPYKELADANRAVVVGLAAITLTALKMPRPRCRHRLHGTPSVNFYKPQGVPLRNLKIIQLTLEEWEALRLKHVENLDQTQSAKKMGVSQSTLQRILSSAQNKTGQAIVKGWAIRIAE